MKLAIVENERSHAEHLRSLLQQWSRERQSILDVAVFSSGEAFLRSDTNAFDLVFMDIQLSGLDGISAAHRLREQAFKGQLVFLTAFSEYVFDGYDVQALNYLLKPIAYDKMAKCMDYAARKLSDDHYTFRNRGSIIQIPYSQIIYFSSANHFTQIITTEGSFRQLESIKNIFTHLPDRFHFCHRTVIVNMEHIVLLRGRELVLSNKAVVPVSHTYIQGIRSSLLSYADSMR